jgi:molybdopterin synthase sulfur carrier subunit
MAVTIRVPAFLRRFADGQERIEVQATSVAEAVTSLCRQREALSKRLLKPNGKVRPSVTLFVNDTQPPARWDTALDDGDTLTIVMPVGGG